MAARKGTAHHLAKLTEDEVRAIRQRHAEGESISQIWLSLDHIDGLQTVWSAITRRTWKHVK